LGAAKEEKMKQEKIMWIVIGVLVVLAAFVLLTNQPAAAAQTGGQGLGAMVGGC